MSALPIDDRGLIVACPQCGQKNRVPFAQLGETGKCGRCSAALPPVSAPLEVDSEARFDALLAGSVLPVLVDFWAPWCGPCVMVAPELEKVAASEAGRLIVAKVNTEDLPVLGQRYEIRSIPAMRLFVGGKEAHRVVGARPAEGILQEVRVGLARA